MVNRCFLFSSILLTSALFAACSAEPPDPKEEEPNQPPRLSADIPARATYTTEDLIEIELTASDPDDEKVNFKVVNKPERATLNRLSKMRAEFRWDPLADERTEQGEPLRLLFVATDPHGAKDEVLHYAHIFPSNGRPNFLNRASRVLNPTQTDRVDITIEVNDDDSSEVELKMKESTAPEGASFQQTGDYKGQFRWRPTADQKSDRIHSVTFIANDGQFDPVEFNLTIIFNNPEKPDESDEETSLQCQEKQRIDHTPLKAKNALGNYEITADLSAEVRQKYDDFYVLWTTDDPFNDGEPTFSSNRLTQNGGQLSGRLKAPVETSSNPEVVYYDICTLDTDAERGDPDRTFCQREPFYFSFLIYDGDNPSCKAQLPDINNFQSAKRMSSDVTSTFRVCTGQSNFHRFEVPGGKVANITVSYPGPGAVELALFNHNKEPIEAPKQSQCIGLARTILNGPNTYFLRVRGADVPYQIKVQQQNSDQPGGNCTRDTLEPNDKIENSTRPAQNKATFSDLSICPKSDIDLIKWYLSKDDSIEAELSFSHAEGNINAKLFGPDQKQGLDPRNRGKSNGVSTNDNELLSYTAQQTGYHFLYIYSAGKANDYSLQLERTCQGDDQLGSGNHSRSNAAAIRVDEHAYTDLKQCPGRPDWYRFTGFSERSYLAHLTPRNPDRILSRVTLEAYDQNGNKVASSTSEDGLRELQFSPDSTEQHYLKVSANSFFRYKLSVLQFEN